jgi:hypothetical protein
VTRFMVKVEGPSRFESGHLFSGDLSSVLVSARNERRVYRKINLASGSRIAKITEVR